MTQRNLFAVKRFWEKPPREIARELAAKGCLWNSFITIGHLPALVGLFMLATPDLYFSLSKIRFASGPISDKQAARRLFEGLRNSDFSRDVLQPLAENLSVLPVGNVGWSDLGEPRRLTSALAGLGLQQRRTRSVEVKPYDDAALNRNRNIRRIHLMASGARALRSATGQVCPHQSSRSRNRDSALMEKTDEG